MLKNWHLVEFINKRLHVRHIYDWLLPMMLHCISNWAYSRAWGSLIAGVGWSFPSIGSSFTSRTKLIFVPYVKSTNSCMMFSASTISSHAKNTYSPILISSLPIMKKEMRVANIFAFIISFSISHLHHPWKIGILIYK